MRDKTADPSIDLRYSQDMKKFFASRVFIATVAFVAGMLVMLGYQNKFNKFSFHVGSNPPMHEEPLDPFEAQMRQMDQLQRQMMQSMGNGAAGAMSERTFNLGGSDLIEADDHYSLEIDLDGLKPENFSVSVEQGQVVVKGEVKGEDSGQSFTQQFQKSFTAPSDVDVDKIQIEDKKTSLVVILPKKKR